MAGYTITQIDSVKEFVNLVERIKEVNENNGNKSDLLFRGQREDKSLLPKLGRLAASGNLNGDIFDVENLMIEEFKKGILPLSEFQPVDDWDILALAQHHGLPTRLLDWTFSALTSLWFAVCNPPGKTLKGKYNIGVVWILAAELVDFRTKTTEYSPFEVPVTKIFRPKIVSRRISAQAGAFTVHKINENGRIVKFETHKKFAHKLTKVKIKGENFAKIRQTLSVLGINHFTVFPDLDGFCKQLQWRFSKLEDEIDIKIPTYYGTAIGSEFV